MHIDEKRRKEIKTIQFMMALYCRKKHHHKEGLCPECEELFMYARKRILLCPFMESKTFCSVCKIHCYQKEKREKIREVMRFSGPRMLWYHPKMAISHMIETWKGKRNI